MGFFSSDKGLCIFQLCRICKEISKYGPTTFKPGLAAWKWWFMRVNRNRERQQSVCNHHKQDTFSSPCILWYGKYEQKILLLAKTLRRTVTFAGAAQGEKQSSVYCHSYCTMATDKSRKKQCNDPSSIFFSLERKLPLFQNIHIKFYFNDCLSLLFDCPQPLGLKEM